MNTVTKCLFGGALMAAGLSSTTVAGEFDWHGASTYVNAPTLSDSATGPGNFDISVMSASGSYASASFDTFSFDLLAYASGNNELSDVIGSMLFEVTEDVTVYFDWDTTGDSTPFGRGSLWSFVDSAYLFNFSAGETGSSSIDLVAGQLYALEYHIIAISGFDTSGQSSFTGTVNAVPLPPAALAGLGMLVGLGAYKRVRRG